MIYILRGGAGEDAETATRTDVSARTGSQPDSRDLLEALSQGKITGPGTPTLAGLATRGHGPETPQQG